MKLWGGRFRSEENKLMEEFNKSFGFDSLLYKKDIEGSLAHVYMQVEVGLLTEEEGKVITNGLKSIEKDIEDGKLGIIADDGFVDSIKAQPLAVNERILTALIEYQQYVKSSWFNELGLNSNFNGMKKEAISDSEQAPQLCSRCRFRHPAPANPCHHFP